MGGGHPLDPSGPGVPITHRYAHHRLIMHKENIQIIVRHLSASDFIRSPYTCTKMMHSLFLNI